MVLGVPSFIGFNQELPGKRPPTKFVELSVKITTESIVLGATPPKELEVQFFIRVASYPPLVGNIAVQSQDARIFQDKAFKSLL